jgi:hypothetical protein
MHRHTITAEFGKVLFAEHLIVEKTRESLHVGECSGMGKRVIQ